MAKKKHTKSTKVSNTVKKTSRRTKVLSSIKYILISMIIVLTVAGVSYYLGTNALEEKEIQKAKESVLKSKIKSDVEKNISTTPELTKRLQDVLKKEHSKVQNTASHEYDEVLPLPPIDDEVDMKETHILKDKEVTPTATVLKKPQLAIIIDDVSFAADVVAIKALNIPLTMSFLPPSKRHPNSAKLAARESFYMVHLPMEAMSFNSEEPYTLRISDSASTVKQRVEQIRVLFPKMRYINNHTGSRFTSDESSMRKLISILRNDNIGFIDSRTTAETKVPKIMKSYNMPYVARDVFLDHYPDVASIKDEIKRAVVLAKKRGRTIAIGHPHKNTLLAIKESKELLKEVELIRVDQLF
jgi:polysaccharide deacetylase 2 family uncharacterized protein YibQ